MLLILVVCIYGLWLFVQIYVNICVRVISSPSSPEDHSVRLASSVQGFGATSRRVRENKVPPRALLPDDVLCLTEKVQTTQHSLFFG